MYVQDRESRVVIPESVRQTVRASRCILIHFIGDLEYITVELFNPSARLNLENISGL